MSHGPSIPDPDGYAAGRQEFESREETLKRTFLFLIALTLSGCAADLKPAPSARTVPGLEEEIAVSSVRGVRMTARADEWPGAVDIHPVVTPLRIMVVNNSGKPLRVSYNLFALVGSDGRRFAALPPYRIGGEVERRVAPGYAPITDPMFSHSSFLVGPGYEPYYPGIRPYAGSYYYDPFYHGAYYPVWQEIERPTDEMIQRVIPEGVLNSGGRVEGYLYFEHVTDDFEKVVFRADLVDAQSGENFGEIRIPFVVE